MAATVAVAADADAVAAGAHQPSPADRRRLTGDEPADGVDPPGRRTSDAAGRQHGDHPDVVADDLPIGNGEQVEADWYFPDVIDSSTHLIYLQHGFMASGPMYSYTAAHLAERTNSIVVAPSLSSNFFDANADWVGGSTLQRAVAKLFEGRAPR